MLNASGLFSWASFLCILPSDFSYLQELAIFISLFSLNLASSCRFPFTNVASACANHNFNDDNRFSIGIHHRYEVIVGVRLLAMCAPAASTSLPLVEYSLIGGKNSSRGSSTRKACMQLLAFALAIDEHHFKGDKIHLLNRKLEDRNFRARYRSCWELQRNLKV